MVLFQYEYNLLFPGLSLPNSKEADFSKTVGLITVAAQACSYCHKQYATKGKVLLHQRTAHAQLFEKNKEETQTKEESEKQQKLASSDLLTQAMTELNHYEIRPQQATMSDTSMHGLDLVLPQTAYINSMSNTDNIQVIEMKNAPISDCNGQSVIVVGHQAQMYQIE